LRLRTAKVKPPSGSQSTAKIRPTGWIACVAPRRLVLAGPVDHTRRRVSQPEAERAYAFPQRIYELFEADENLVLSASAP